MMTSANACRMLACVCLFVALAGVGSAVGQQVNERDAATPAVPGVHGANLRARLQESSVRQGEPVVLLLDIANGSTETIYLDSTIAEVKYGFEVTHSSGGEVARTSYGRRAGGGESIKGTWLAPRETQADVVTLNAIYDLSLSGEYTIKAKCTARIKQPEKLVRFDLVSNKVSLLVNGRISKPGADSLKARVDEALSLVMCVTRLESADREPPLPQELENALWAKLARDTGKPFGKDLAMWRAFALWQIRSAAQEATRVSKELDGLRGQAIGSWRRFAGADADAGPAQLDLIVAERVLAVLKAELAKGEEGRNAAAVQWAREALVTIVGTDNDTDVELWRAAIDKLRAQGGSSRNSPAGK